MEATNNNVQVAETILAQLGGSRFCAMTGAKNFVAIENGVTFKIGRNDAGVTHVKITLNALDTYDVKYLRVWGAKITEKGFASGIYYDQLRGSFEVQTGMAISL